MIVYLKLILWLEKLDFDIVEEIKKEMFGTLILPPETYTQCVL